ncbi:hypothetical protein P886_1840 [Alteromonadaceae bacterium 2753L.S.0a.02]|nr:hypothetical protein P886_1840 [Alteromonadaceae bacterium 2753L.S.0a.02]
MSDSQPPQKPPSVDIRAHHAQCELNFYRLINLMPDWQDGRDEWAFSLGDGIHYQVRLQVVDSARYTTTVEVVQHLQGIKPPRLVVRLYHDANMAEIISWDRHRNWQAQYDYPNPQMYAPDEKMELNRFLGDWLEFCHSQGYVHSHNCEMVLVKRK